MNKKRSCQGRIVTFNSMLLMGLALLCESVRLKPTRADAPSNGAAYREPGVQRVALQLARDALGGYLRDGKLPSLPANLPAALLARRAVIVTMELPGRLAPRGCRGTLQSRYNSLAEEIRHNAVAAATRDLRVPGLRLEELSRCRISLTVVLGLQRIESLTAHDTAEGGLVARQGSHIGIVLPYEGHDAARQWTWALRKAGLGTGETAEMLELKAVRFKEAT